MKQVELCRLENFKGDVVNSVQVENTIHLYWANYRHFKVSFYKFTQDRFEQRLEKKREAIRILEEENKYRASLT